MIDFAAELMLLVPAIRVIVRFRTSALRRLVAFPAVYRPAKGDAYRVILHRSVYCPPHGCSDFHLRSKRCSDLFVDGSRLLQRYHYLYTAYMQAIVCIFTGISIAPRQVAEPSAPSWTKSMVKCSSMFVYYSIFIFICKYFNAIFLFFLTSAAHT